MAESVWRSLFSDGGPEMLYQLNQLIEKMTPQERVEVEAFAAFVIARRNLQRYQILFDDISSQEMIKLVTAAGSFDWLSAEEEDVYSIKDGEAVQWPSTP
jgi:hypothetical protein